MQKGRWSLSSLVISIYLSLWEPIIWERSISDHISLRNAPSYLLCVGFRLKGFIMESDITPTLTLQSIGCFWVHIWFLSIMLSMPVGLCPMGTSTSEFGVPRLLKISGPEPRARACRFRLAEAAQHWSRYYVITLGEGGRDPSNKFNYRGGGGGGGGSVRSICPLWCTEVKGFKHCRYSILCLKASISNVL